MNFFKPFLIILTAAFFFSITAMGSTSKKIVTKAFLENQEVQQAIQKYLALKNVANTNEDNVGVVNLLNQIKAFQKSDTKQNNLKSASSNTNHLDSLLVERWNETTAKLEASQLEKWTWYENGMGESWELYDLDSISEQWSPNDKEEYVWDENGNKLLHIDYDPDSITGGWRLNGKEITTFDANDNELTHMLLFWNSATEAWENNKMTINTYDLEGNKTEGAHTIWDSLSNAWKNFEKEVFAYNDQGNLLRDEVFEWDEAKNDWVSKMFIRYEYDENGHESLQELVMEEFFFHALLEYVNDSNGNQLEVITWNWNFMTNTYFYSLKNTHTYSIDGNELSWWHYTWDATNSVWLKSWETNYKYDGGGYLIYSDRFYQVNTVDSLIAGLKDDYINNVDGNPILRTHMLWDITNNVWVNNYQQQYTYDDQKRLNYIVEYDWDVINSKWIGDYNEIHHYDLYGNFLEHAKQKYDTTSNQWIDEFIDEYSYDLSMAFSDIYYPNSWAFRHLSNLVSLKQCKPPTNYKC